MFAVGCKTSSAAVDFNAKLGPYLADELGEDPQKFSAAVTQLGAARAMVAGTTAKVEPSEPMVQKLMTYIGQLGALKKHFPINQGEKVGVHPSAFSPRRHLFLELLTPGLTRPNRACGHPAGECPCQVGDVTGRVILCAGTHAASRPPGRVAGVYVTSMFGSLRDRL